MVKKRNVKCQFDGENPNVENYKCLSDSNYSKVKDLKESYLNFKSLENNLIKPFKYEVGIQKKLEIGGEFKHEVRQFQKPYDNQQAEQISLMV